MKRHCESASDERSANDDDPVQENPAPVLLGHADDGLGEYPIYGSSTARVCRDYDVDLVGHTGEKDGLLSGMFFRPGTKDGFLYALNGVGIELDEDPRSVGQFSGNYIWEEKIMDAICRALWGKEFQADLRR